MAGWISRFTGADIIEMEVPQFSGWEKLSLLKLKSRILPGADKIKAEEWLRAAGGGGLLETSRKKLGAQKSDSWDALFLSAGSGAAPFTLALAKALGQRCCTIMTPSVLGTSPFNFAIIPEHDHPKKGKNILATLGAPNAIFPDQLERKGWELAQKYPPADKNRTEKWALLIGGDDDNYRISMEWIRRTIPYIVEAAVKTGAEIYITTSRRTSPDAEEELSRLTRGYSAVRMVLLASKDSFNPVPGMLGLCSRVYVTEDSVSMVSEAVTAGRAVFLMRVERQSPIKASLQNLTALFVKGRLLPQKILWGTPRFDVLFAAMKNNRFLNEIRYDNQYNYIKNVSSPPDDGPLLNEARRAAEWIVDEWSEW